MIMTTSAGSAPWDDRGRLASRIAVALTVVATTYVIATSHVTTPLIPVFASLMTLFGQTRRSAVALRTIALIVMFVFAWLGLASVGIFFLPGVFAMGMAVTRTSVAETA